MRKLLMTLGLALLMANLHAETLRISGSTSVLPLLQRIAVLYQEHHPTVRIQLGGGGSGTGLADLIDGQVDIAMSSRFLRPEEFQAAAERGVYPVPLQLAHDAIVPVVHPHNPVRELSLQQLQAIYAGREAYWTASETRETKILSVCRDGQSGTQATWRHLVMQDAPSIICDRTVASNQAVLSAVRDNPNAIGYVSLVFISAHAGVRPLRVNNQAGTPECVRSGCYALTRPFFLFSNGWPDQQLMRFIDFALYSPTARRLMRQMGLIPVG